jgi:hypothetical protein
MAGRSGSAPAAAATVAAPAEVDDGAAWLNPTTYRKVQSFESASPNLEKRRLVRVAIPAKPYEFRVPKRDGLPAKFTRARMAVKKWDDSSIGSVGLA